MFNVGLKKFVLNKWFNIKSFNFIVNGGKVNNISEDVINVVYVNIGICMYVIFGVCILIMVIRKLIFLINVLIFEICKLSI